MTDRLKGCTVVFDEDMRTDDAEPLLNAIRLIKGVQSVHPEVNTVGEEYYVRQRFIAELCTAMYDFIEELRTKKK